MAEKNFPESKITQAQACKIAERVIWQDWSQLQQATFQLNEQYLCMPFETFHKAIELSLGRPVYTHEFIDMNALRNELHGDKEPPTFEEILGMIPEDKRIIVLTNGTGSKTGSKKQKEELDV